jgi:spermidine synthase
MFWNLIAPVDDSFIPRHQAVGVVSLGRCLLLAWFLGCQWASVPAAVVFEETSPYHHIRVVDQQGMRTLMFDNATESRQSLADPLQGHFEYSEYFHTPWLWNPEIKSVLMIGLGGGTVALAWQHYYSNVLFEAVELDPKVVKVARDFFQLKESAGLRVHTEDGRVFLRRSQKQYDVILMDAFTANRYGSFIPYSLVTREFFALARQHLTTNGVLAYNVIGNAQSERENIVSSVYQTMTTAFPRVYYFPATVSKNVVLVAVQSPSADSLPLLNQRYSQLTIQGWRTLPTLKNRLQNFRSQPPPAAARSRVLTDDFAPTDGLLSTDK